MFLCNRTRRRKNVFVKWLDVTKEPGGGWNFFGVRVLVYTNSVSKRKL